MDILPQDNTPRKQCTGPCGRTLPATLEYFSPDRRNKNGLQARCKRCAVEQHKAYAAKHKEELKLYKATYRAEHPDYQKNYYVEHREEISKQRETYYRERSEHLRKYSAQYRQTERGRMSIKSANHNRKARKKSAGGSHTAVELQEQFHRQRGRCYYCKVKLGKRWHGDHIIPLSKGGSNSIDNIVVACPDCNQSKYNKMLHEWRDGGRLL